MPIPPERTSPQIHPHAQSIGIDELSIRLISQFSCLSRIFRPDSPPPNAGDHSSCRLGLLSGPQIPPVFHHILGLSWGFP